MSRQLLILVYLLVCHADEPTADEPTADEPTADEPTAAYLSLSFGLSRR